MGGDIIMFKEKRDESSIVGACVVHSVIFPKSQGLPTVAGPTPSVFWEL